MVDIFVEIVPGVGVAGFNLGQSINEVKSYIFELKKWQYNDGISLYKEIKSTSEWLSYIPEGENVSETLYFGREMIELHFNSEGKLAEI